MATTRLPVETFDIPVQKMRRGYLSAVYFWRAKQIAEKYDVGNRVHMQVFQKHDAILCGIDEAIALLKLSTGYWHDPVRAYECFDKLLEVKRDKSMPAKARHFAMAEYEEELELYWVDQWDQLEVKALHEGDSISPREPVLEITGPYSAFAHLESAYLGVLARRSRVATNVRNCVNAANGKPILFFADRFDHWTNQTGDGYAAHVGGATGIATDAMGAWWGKGPTGTMPHALIACFGGDVVAACKAFSETYPDVDLIALVDFNNDCVQDALACAEALGDRLWGVRLDTSETMVDKAVYDSGVMGDFDPRGVNPQLVDLTRKALDREGYGDVKIVPSGGFNPTKITHFENLAVPTDAYAVGSSLLSNPIDFTADIVKPNAKAGRWHRDTNRLELVS